MTSFSLKYHIVITISTAIHTKQQKTSALIFVQFPTLISCDYNFNPCGSFEKITSFTQILNQDLAGTRKLNGGRKFSKIKGPKNVSSNDRNRLKFGNIFRKDL